jgi:glutaredoxin
MKIAHAFSVIFIAFSALAQGGALYRWVDSQGNVHYSDTPPPASAKQVEKKPMKGAAPEDASQLPYATQMAARNFPVTLYTTDCGEACAKARSLLAKRGIPFAEKNAEQPADQEELSKLLGGQLEVPVLKVGSNVVRGYEESQWQSALDIAGYPRNAGAAPPPPAPKPEAPKAEPRGEPEAGEAPPAEVESEPAAPRRGSYPVPE